MHNSPLREQPREQRANVIPLKHESSLLDWLQSSGRLISRDNVHEPDFSDEEEEISGLIDPDDVADIYEDDDDAEVEVED
jgi:hypothetical protein